MRIMFFASEFPKFTETFVAREAMAFHDRGHEVRMAHLKPYRTNEIVHEFMEPLLSRTVTKSLTSPGAWLTALSEMARRPATAAGVLATIVGRCVAEPDILAKNLGAFVSGSALAQTVREWRAEHIHAAFAGFPGTAAWVAHKLTGVPFSVSCHAHDIFITQSLLGPKLSSAEFVRVISAFNEKFLRDKVSSLPSDVDHMGVIRCGVDVDASSVEPMPARDPLRVIYVGSLIERKGVHDLLAALDKVRGAGVNFTCLVIGDGPERERLEALSASLGLTGQVTFAGKKTQNEIFQALPQAHVFVAPSIKGKRGRAEGIPVVLMEALAHGRPVITTRLSGIPELVEYGVNGWLFEPGDIDELAQRIADAHADFDRLEGMGRAGRAKVVAEYNTHVNAQALVTRLAGAHQEDVIGAVRGAAE